MEIFYNTNKYLKNKKNLIKWKQYKKIKKQTQNINKNYKAF